MNVKIDIYKNRKEDLGLSVSENIIYIAKRIILHNWNITVQNWVGTLILEDVKTSILLEIDLHNM